MEVKSPDTNLNTRPILKHYLLHLIISLGALLFFYLIFGSVTVWEICLYLIFTFILFIDELLYAVINYLNAEDYRQIINRFLTGEFRESFYYLHEKRRLFEKLVIHNLAIYFILWSLWYIFLIYDASLPFYALSGIQIHLLIDIINDKYEFDSIRKWLWPVYLLIG